MAIQLIKRLAMTLTRGNRNQTNKESLDLIQDIHRIDLLTNKLIDSTIRYTPLKRELTSLLKVSEERLSNEAPLYYLTPYIEAFFSAKSAVFGEMLEYELDRAITGKLITNAKFQDFRNFLVRYTSTKEFKDTLKRTKKSEKKRKASSDRYLTALISNYARLIVVRLDLHLSNESRLSNLTIGLFDNIANYWRQLRRDLKESNAIPKPVGFITSLEHGHYRGFHLHLALFFDGSRHQSDVMLAKAIGEHWKHKVTSGDGDYHNCNACGPNGYRRYGIGRVEHWDKAKIENLRFAVDYLSKTDHALEALIDGRRTFFRGNMPKPKSKRGRRRKIHQHST